jgi:HK97 family phage portal protein
LKSLKDRIQGLEEKALPLQGQQFSIVNGQLTATPDNKKSYIDNGYSVNDIVYSIVNLILDKIRVAPWGLYKVVDESSLKSYNGLIRKKNLSGKEYKRALSLHQKALEPITNANNSTGKLMELLKWPNDEETYNDYVAAGCGYKLLTGDKYQWANLLDMGANKGIPQELWNLPSQVTKILALKGFPPRKVGYQFEADSIYQYPKEEVSHELYWNPNWGINQQLNGMAPLKAALKTITRNNSAKDASSSKFQNNGLEAVIYVDEPGISDAQGKHQHAKATKQALISEYTGTKNQGKIAVSPYKMGVANLGLSPVELGIIEAEKWDAVLLCAIYGVPPELIGVVSKTYNNVVEAEKALTSRSALPLLTSHRDNYNRKLQTDWGFRGQNVYVDYDVSVYTELQEDVNQILDWTNKLIAVRPNEQRTLAGLEADPDPLMDQLWVTTAGRQPLEDYQIGAVDEALNPDNENVA